MIGIVIRIKVWSEKNHNLHVFQDFSADQRSVSFMLISFQDNERFIDLSMFIQCSFIVFHLGLQMDIVLAIYYKV